ncbi:Asp23/Gls24 family envelope stress response protein [Phycicoccus flavus]|uniref:Asp23/Gls24 family envelope stress response protein n=1 Tax=Phycicoccus flavus TaxID=2502783 RepID=A0A8T6R815_9MICO|nr:hypothetical protein [Phycicoccus flavus]NHA70137.1 hypothetical protein [Phycicoccus flavus]
MTERSTLADRIAVTVRDVPGVSALHAGALGEAVTLLPGRRVPGVRVGDDAVEVHLAVSDSRPVRETADAVRTAVTTLTDLPVTVVVEDLADDVPTA